MINLRRNLLGDSESRQLVEHLERMIVDGERMLAYPKKYGLDEDEKKREGILLMVNQLRAKKEMLEGELLGTINAFKG